MTYEHYKLHIASLAHERDELAKTAGQKEPLDKGKPFKY